MTDFDIVREALPKTGSLRGYRRFDMDVQKILDALAALDRIEAELQRVYARLDTEPALVRAETAEAERDEARKATEAQMGFGTRPLLERAKAAEARVIELEEVLRTGGLLRNDLLKQLRRDGHGYPSFHVAGCPGCALLGEERLHGDVDPDLIPGVRNTEPGL